MKFSSNAALLCGLTTLGLFSVVGASPIIARQSFPVNSAFDDAHGNGPPGSGLTYSGDWVHLSQQAGLGLNHDTESYTSDPNGYGTSRRDMVLAYADSLPLLLQILLSPRALRKRRIIPAVPDSDVITVCSLLLLTRTDSFAILFAQQID